MWGVKRMPRKILCGNQRPQSPQEAPFQTRKNQVSCQVTCRVSSKAKVNFEVSILFLLQPGIKGCMTTALTVLKAASEIL